MSYSDELARLESAAVEAQQAAASATDPGERQAALRHYHAIRASEGVYRRLHAPGIAKEQRDAAAAAPSVALPPAPDPTVTPHLARHAALLRANPIAAGIYASCNALHLHRERASLEADNT